MDNDSTKSQQTGGLKIMTVFIVVLALHVLVIGGFTVYHLVSGGAADVDLASDKSHKSGTDTTASTASTTDSTTPDKTTPATDVASTPAPASGTDMANTDQSAAQVTPAPAPAPQSPIVIPTPAPTAPAPAVVSAPAPQPQSAPVTASAPEQSSPPQPLAPPADTTDMAATSPQTPTGPISSNGAAIAPQTAPLAGPVHMPPPSSHVAGGEHEHGQIYTVKITDSYKKIARSHHVTVAQLKLANHISNNTLHAGQKLVIPASKTVLADAGTTSLDAPETESRLKPTTTAYTTSTMTTDVTSHHHLYTVQRGDTLKKIARKFNTSPAAILGVNSISNPAKLTIGKKLRIPSAESRSAHLTAPAAEPSVSQPTTPSQVQAAPSHMDGESATANGELANFAP